MDWVAERTGGEASTSGNSDEGQGRTVIYVGVKGRGIVGHMAFSDTLREDAADVVQRLKKLGVRVILLSGDRQAAASGMALQVIIIKPFDWPFELGLRKGCPGVGTLVRELIVLQHTNLLEVLTRIV